VSRHYARERIICGRFAGIVRNRNYAFTASPTGECISLVLSIRRKALRIVIPGLFVPDAERANHSLEFFSQRAGHGASMICGAEPNHGAIDSSTRRNDAYTLFDHFVRGAAFAPSRGTSRRNPTSATLARVRERVSASRCDAPESGVGLDEHVAPSSDTKIAVIEADITRPLPLPDELFDHVTLLAVLEHLGNPEPVLREAHRILRCGGSLIMTWPSAAVDPILEVLTRVGMVNHDLGFDQHQPRIPSLSSDRRCRPSASRRSPTANSSLA